MSIIQSLKFNVFCLEEGEISFPGHVIQSIFFNLLRKGDPGLATYIHDLKAMKGYSVTPLLYTDSNKKLKLAWKIRKKLEYFFKISIYGKPLSNAALTILKGLETSFNIYNANFTLESVEVSVKTYEGIQRQSTPINSFSIMFISPTCFKNFETNLVSLFPTPFRVLDSALRVWNNFAPEKHRFKWVIEGKETASPYREWIKTCVSEKKFKVKSVKPIEPYKLPGFTGQTTYIIKKQRGIDEEEHEEYCKITDTLLKFAETVNVGSQRTTGMGVIEVKTNTKPQEPNQ